MRVLIALQRYPVLAAGLVVAAIADLALGSAVHPDLSGPGIGGPRMLVPFGGARSDGVASANSGWSGSSRMAPDYVLGTDWTHPKVVPAEVAEPIEPDEAEAQSILADAREIAPPGGSAVWDHAIPPPRYPLIAGNAVYSADASDAAPDDDPALDD